MKIAIIYDLFREDTLGEYYKRALTRAGNSVKHFWLRKAGEIRPEYDLYFRVDDGEYQFDIPHDKLRPAIFYASDVHLKKPFKKIKALVPLYDKVFCAQYDGFLKLSHFFKNKVFWVPHAADAFVHRDLRVTRNLNIGFVGNDGGLPRKFLLQELRERFPNSFIGPAPYTMISEIYSHSKIVFNYSINNDINMRMFEALNCGALLLTNFIKDNGFNELFEDRRHLVVYRDPKEMFELLKYYLVDERERTRIADEGKALALEKFTYDNRITEILNCAKM
jgi:hypothetical protein